MFKYSMQGVLGILFIQDSSGSEYKMFISNKEVAKLKRKAHRLKPLVQIGKKGVTDEQIETIKKLLKDHELIKVKFNEFKF